MTDIKPCPWCGGTDVEVVEGSTFRWRVAVCSCGAQAPDVRVQTLGEGTPEEWDAQGIKDAMAEWNNRAAVPQSAEVKE